MWKLFLLAVFCLYCNAQGEDYVVKVTTSDAFMAGTDADVKVVIIGTEGTLGPTELSTKSDDFERGRTDVFVLRGHDYGYVKGLEIRRDGGLFSDWRLEKVVVQVSGHPDALFYYYDWVPENQWTRLTLSCPSGYQVNQLGYCSDVDECISGEQLCDLITSLCVNEPGSYSCTCRDGYIKQSEGNCVDLDECSDGSHTCDLFTSVCVNEPGMYSCVCRSGFIEESKDICQAKTCTGSEALGMQSGKIANQSITASSYHAGYPPWNARLWYGSQRAWYAEFEDVSSWIQVDFGKHTWIRGVATQGKRFSMFVKTFKLAYSTDSVDWITYKDNNQIEKVFQANEDPYNAVTNELVHPVYTRFVRIYPQTWQDAIVLKIEFYGCTPV